MILQRVSLFNFGEQLFFLHLLHRIFDVFDGSNRFLIDLAASLSVNVEAKYLRLIKIDLRWHYYGVGEVLQEHVRKACSEVRTIDVDLSEFGKVNLFAARTKDLEAGCLQDVAETHWQHLLLVAECSGAEAVNPGQILLVNFSKTAW